MFNFRLLNRYWVAVLIWMVVIFAASADRHSSEHSSRFIEPLVRWLFPHISATTMEVMVTLVRKGAHLTEYALLAVLVWSAWQKTTNNGCKTWSWSTAGWILLFITAYAATDECHQLFVPSRQGCVTDVLIDALGGMFGLLLMRGLGIWRGRRILPE